MTVQGLGYVVIETTDKAKWHEYLTKIVGAMANGEGSDGAALYRLDERAARFRVIRGEADRFAVAGWELADAAAFQSMKSRLADAGCVMTDCDATRRGVAALACGKDPAGSDFEIFYGPDEASSPFESPAGVTGFVTGKLGMGHVVYGSLAFHDTHNFYRDTMGFGDTDLPEIEAGPPGSPKMGIAFMHAATGRHHSVAVIQMPEPPAGCVHIMVEARTRADVDAAYQRMQAADVPVSATLGQHTNDEVISFYMQTPGGFDLEFGWDGLVVDPATWVPTAHTEVSKWGHEWAWQKAAAKAAAEEANG
ncbi:MAG: VOC family protein [Sphingomonadales bacterium]|nr:VOC family protein [Sphingomonadales bacterium]